MTPTDIRDTAIPEDVMEAASVLVRETIENYERNKPANGSRDAIARAIMAATEAATIAERERCAKVARAFQPPSFLNLNDRGIAIAIRDNIAAAIRAGTKGASDE